MRETDPTEKNNEPRVWRGIVNSNPVEREIYNLNSLRDYFDSVMEHYHELVGQADMSHPDAEWQILMDLVALMDDQFEYMGDMGPVRIQGNGIYIPSDSEEFKFLDGTKGISGEYAGFSIEEMPYYQDLLYPADGELQVQSVLCMELGNWREYSDSDIELEPREDTVLVPIEGQDLSFTRVIPMGREDNLSYYD